MTEMRSLSDDDDGSLAEDDEVDASDADEGDEDDVPALDATNVGLAFETILIEIYRIVRKNLEAGKYDPDRPAPRI